MDKVEEFKQELDNIEKQITAKLEEIKALKQYRKSIELAMRLKQKVEDKQKTAAALTGKEESQTGV